MSGDLEGSGDSVEEFGFELEWQDIFASDPVNSTKNIKALQIMFVSYFLFERGEA